MAAQQLCWLVNDLVRDRTDKPLRLLVLFFVEILLIELVIALRLASSFSLCQFDFSFLSCISFLQRSQFDLFEELTFLSLFLLTLLIAANCIGVNCFGLFSLSVVSASKMQSGSANECSENGCDDWHCENYHF